MTSAHAMCSTSLVGLALPLFLGVLAVPADSLGATELGDFEKALHRVAPEPPKAAKHLCMCTGGIAYVGELRPAFAAFNGIVEYPLICEISTFNPITGAVTATRQCEFAFEVLGK